MELLTERHPYEMIRETRDNPDHFRVYTVAELRELAAHVGLETVEYEIKNYFKRNTPVGMWFDKLVGYFLLASFSTGINIIFQKPE